MTNIVTGKELSKLIKDAIIDKFGKMKSLSVKASKTDVQVTFYNVPLEDIKEVVSSVIEGVLCDKFINIKSVQLWKEFTTDYMKENEWMKDNRMKTIKIYNKVQPIL